MKKTIIIAVIVAIIAVAIYLLKGDTMPAGIQQGDTVTISYKATLPDGRIFSNNEQEVIVIGENTLPGVDNKLIGQNSGDLIITTITPEEGFSIYYDPNKLQRMPIYTLTQAGVTPEPGKFILLGGTRYYIQSIENDIAVLDTNPEHTRQNLKYNIQILGHKKQ